jgi:hypothetical protein
MMDIHAVLEQLNAQFPEYVIRFKSVPEEEGLVSINVFGVARSDFNDIKEFIFDLEESFSGEEIFIPICYTRQEVLDHYPAIASEYLLKQKASLKKKETAVFASAFMNYDLLDCSCSQRLMGDASGLDQFLSLPPIWSSEKNKEAIGFSTQAADESYALAA